MYKLTLITMHQKKKVVDWIIIFVFGGFYLYKFSVDELTNKKQDGICHAIIQISHGQREYRYKVRVIDSFFTEIEPKLEPGSKECICRHVSNVYTYSLWEKEKKERN
jgi:hypothetical protein